VELIAKLLGHANVSTTLESYIHSDAAGARKALETLEDAWLERAPKRA
jgi:integrase